jgi:hypothetical protein
METNTTTTETPAQQTSWYDKPEYTVREDRLAGLQHRIDIMNRRAAKLGITPIQIVPVSEELRKVYRPSLTYAADGCMEEVPGVLAKWITIRIVGETPKLAGYEFVATLQRTEAGNIIRSVPGADNVPTMFRDSKPCCDHCKLQRNRVETFIVRHESGVYKQVGRQCIADFLGKGDPKLIAAQAEHIIEACLAAASEDDNDGEFMGRGSNRPRYYSTEAILALSAQAIIQFGWFSKRTAQEKNCTSTVSRVYEYVNPRPQGKSYRKVEKLEKPTPEANALAQTARQYIIDTYSAKEETLGDFEHNLLTIARLNEIEGDQFGLACYLVQHYRREVEKVEIARKSNNVNSKHIGQPKDRIRGLEVTFVWEHSFETQFGVKTMHKFNDAEGNVLLWSTTSGATVKDATGDRALMIGDVVKVTFTIKEHGEYRSIKQTEITRLKVDALVKSALPQAEPTAQAA